MPLPRLIPCLDVAGGRVVKGVQFQNLRDMGDPCELATIYSDAGADELVFLDITATLQGRDTMRSIVERVADSIAIPFSVGGGVRTVADAEALLRAGADKVAVNTAAVERPALITELAALMGSQAVVVAIDVKARKVHTRAGTAARDLDAVAWAREVEERGAGEILLTSMDTDGMRGGYDLAVTRDVADAVRIPVIASGGAGSAADVAAALEVAQAALMASIVHEDSAGFTRLRAELTALGVPLRDVA